MFHFSLRASLTTLVASAVAVSAAPSLSVKTSTPSVNVDGLENLNVITTVINTGDESLKLLNDFRGVLGPFPENALIITNPAGSRPLFNNTMVMYDPTYDLDDPRVFTVLAAGASINITYDVSTAYNFARSGAGNYSIEPSNLFTYVDVGGTLKDLYATVGDIAEVRLSGNLAVSRALDKRGTMINCTLYQQLDIYLAALKAQIYARNAYCFLDSIDEKNPPPRYTRWFGQYTFLRKLRVQETFKRMIDYHFATWTYNCDCDIDDYEAHVKKKNPSGTIIICPGFWKLPTTGFLSQAGTLIHEVSHFDNIGDTEDYKWDPQQCLDLAIRAPYFSIENANNVRFFAEEGSLPACPGQEDTEGEHENSAVENENPIIHDELRACIDCAPL